jgi:hypothetical protein
MAKKVGTAADYQSVSSTTAAAHDESSSSRKARAIKNDVLSTSSEGLIKPLRILGVISFLIVLLVGSVAAGVAVLQQQQQQHDHHYQQQQSSHRRVNDILRYSIGRRQHLRFLVTFFSNWDSKSREGGEVGGGAPVLPPATAAALVQSITKNGNDGLASEAGVDRIAEATPVTSSGTYLFVICIYVFLS